MTAPRSVIVTTGSRLHFGLFAFDAERGLSFGGAGIMVSEPQLEVRATAGERFSAAGPMAERASAVVARLVEVGLLDALPKCRVEVRAAPPAHSGLGSGTQLALAVATAVSKFAKNSSPDAAVLAPRIGRGRRSAIGTHGFARGGLLVDSGKSPQEAIAPLAARVALPEAWRVVLLLPTGDRGLAGDAEERAFARLPEVPTTTTAVLRQLAFDEIVAAAGAAEFVRFSAAASEFNAISGACFAAVQGGAYASPTAARWIERLAALGAPAGQSSWGPTLFAFAEDQGRAELLAGAIRGDALADGYEVVVARPRNTGASIDVV